jgi:hypothetical protein
MIALAFFAVFGFVLALFAGAYAGGAHKRLDELEARLAEQRTAAEQQCAAVAPYLDDADMPGRDPFAFPKDGKNV